MDVYGCLWMFMMDISIVGFINQLRIFGSPWGPHLVLLYLWGCCHCCLSGGSIWAKNDHKKWWKSWAASTRLFWSCGSCDTVGPLLGFNIQIHQNPPFPVVISSNTQSLNSLAAMVSFEYSHTTSRFSMKPQGVVSRNSLIFTITQYWPTSSPSPWLALSVVNFFVPGSVSLQCSRWFLNFHWSVDAKIMATPHKNEYGYPLVN